jgi:hypothetical protein
MPATNTKLGVGARSLKPYWSPPPDGPCGHSAGNCKPPRRERSRKDNLLHIVGYSVSEQNGDWTITRIFSGSLTRMQAQYALKYL